MKPLRETEPSQFQSHFGLILTSGPANSPPKKLQGFQSHFGLILTLSERLQEPVQPTFQSHFGLILTQENTGYHSANMGFNPILV